jgi:N-terminal acetyltransferase B complex non-catalytic subunit
MELGNYKKAVQDVEKVLRKNPTLQCARALKAWAYIRLGKDEESSEIVQALEKENTADVTTLQVLTMCYKETEKCKGPYCLSFFL